MKWKKGKCEICEFWKSEMDSFRDHYLRFSTSGLCYFFPDQRETYTTNKCGAFKKAGRLEILRRRKLTKKALAKRASELSEAKLLVSEKEFKTTRFEKKVK